MNVCEIDHEPLDGAASPGWQKIKGAAWAYFCFPVAE